MCICVCVCVCAYVRTPALFSICKPIGRPPRRHRDSLPKYSPPRHVSLMFRLLRPSLISQAATRTNFKVQFIEPLKHLSLRLSF